MLEKSPLEGRSGLPAATASCCPRSSLCRVHLVEWRRSARLVRKHGVRYRRALPGADLQNHFPREKRFPPFHRERRKPLLLSTETSFRTRPFQGRRRKECERGGSEGRL
ncbi:hypothetical protein ISCGN_022413 [Ixodes scapularis]